MSQSDSITPDSASSPDNARAGAASATGVGDEHSSAGYGVQPEDVPPESKGKEAAERRRILANGEEDELIPAHELERRQLSMSGLLIVVTTVCAVLAPVSFMPLPVYSAVLGVIVLLLFLFAAILGAKELIVRVTIWALLGLYVVTLALAAWEQMR